MMISKKVIIITLAIIALLLASVSLNTYLNESKNKVSTNTNNQGTTEDNGNGKVGVIILPPTVEDKNNGS